MLTRVRNAAFSVVRWMAHQCGYVLARRNARHFFSEDGLTVQHNVTFFHDARFAQAYRAGVATGSWGGYPIRWRAFVACWVAEQCAALPGDFVECGVNRGGLSTTIIEYLEFKRLRKRFFLLDTFNGLDEALLSATEKSRDHVEDYPDCFAEVTARFSTREFVKIIRGRVPDTLGEVDTDQVAFVSIDMNCAAPEIAAAEFFWPKLAPGGMMLLDDYGFSGYEEQHDAFDAFAKRVGVTLFALPTGQAVLRKPSA